MKVILMDYTGAGNLSDPWYAARLLIYAKNTRLEQSPANWEKLKKLTLSDMEPDLLAISKTLRSSWEFIDFTFQIVDVTRAFTHQLVRTRTASYAQQAQRVVNMTGFRTLVPETVQGAGMEDQWELHMAHTSDFYRAMMERGVPAQDCRGVLPTNVYTNILVKMNLRTFADLVGKRENLRAQGEYADVVRLMKQEALDVMPWLPPFLNPERTKTPALDHLMKVMLGDRSPAEVPELNDALKELDLLKGTWG